LVASRAVFDHVQIAVADLGASERFYREVLGGLGAEPVRGDEALVEWEDWDVALTDGDHPVSSGLHVAFRAADPSEAFAPAPDLDGNSVEAVHDERARTVPGGGIDHLRLRVRDLEASRSFYETIAPHAGLRPGGGDPGRVEFAGADSSLWLVADEGPPTAHVHIAFSADEDAAVRAFHAAALAAGYADNGPPGERLAYHPGYYGAFVLDPDGHNIEVVNHNRP
jgi:catechol 2,3-dioxygenase-like lactoylglutathione lyase family enzyme